MLLEPGEVDDVLQLVKQAFPNFSDWEVANEADNEHPDFTVWGEYVTGEGIIRQHFFVTFDIYDSLWQGTLSIGQHSYFWSSTNEGDAYLVSTNRCNTLEEAIAELKKEMGDLFAAFLGMPRPDLVTKGK